MVATAGVKATILDPQEDTRTQVGRRRLAAQLGLRRRAELAINTVDFRNAGRGGTFLRGHCRFDTETLPLGCEHTVHDDRNTYETDIGLNRRAEWWTGLGPVPRDRETAYDLWSVAGHESRMFKAAPRAPDGRSCTGCSISKRSGGCSAVPTLTASAHGKAAEQRCSS